nr:MAG TPA: hypothetical protein [Caudoviricetes sp.]
MWNLSAIERISIDTSFPVRLWKLHLPRQWSNWLNPYLRRQVNKNGQEDIYAETY